MLCQQIVNTAILRHIRERKTACFYVLGQVSSLDSCSLGWDGSLFTSSNYVCQTVDDRCISEQSVLVCLVFLLTLLFPINTNLSRQIWRQNLESFCSSFEVFSSFLVLRITVDLPNFEHVPYFEHHVNKEFSKSTTYKLINLVHKDVYI